MTDAKTRFEVRKGLLNPKQQNAIIEAGYDTVNRMAALLDEINFDDFLTQPFKELVPRILANLELTTEYGLIDDPDEVRALFTRLMAGHADENFQALATAMCDDDAALSRELWSPTWKLWVYHGIKLPEFNRYPDRNVDVKKAIDDLVREAPEFTYRTIHETPRTKDLRAVSIAVRQAVENLIIYLPHNGLCCTCASGCSCVPAITSDYCIIIGSSCSSASTGCGNSSPFE